MAEASGFFTLPPGNPQNYALKSDVTAAQNAAEAYTDSVVGGLEGYELSPQYHVPINQNMFGLTYNTFSFGVVPETAWSEYMILSHVWAPSGNGLSIIGWWVDPGNVLKANVTLIAPNGTGAAVVADLYAQLLGRP